MNRYKNQQKPPNKVARFDSNETTGLNNGAAPSESTEARIELKSDDDDDTWGEDDDELLLIATQMAEKQEGIIGVIKPSPPLYNKGFPRVNSDEKSGITPAENLALRRQLLEDKTRNDDYHFQGVSGPTEEDMKLAMEKIGTLEQQRQSLVLEVQKLKGEQSFLRGSNSSLKNELQVKAKAAVLSELDMKQKIKSDDDKKNEQIKQLNHEIQELKAKIVQAKFSRKSGSPSVGNRSSLNNSINSNTQLQSLALNTQASMNAMSGSLATLDYVKSPSSSIKEVQTDPLIGISNIETQLVDSLTQKLSVRLEDEDLVENSASSEELTADVLRRIDEIVELRYQLILPKLEEVVKSAPKEIMKRLVRNCDIKSAFPDVVDSMFQWGLDKERKKARAVAGIQEPKPLILPCQYERGVHFYTIKIGIEARFRFDGVWGALIEVRELLQQVLKSLEGDQRYRLYEYNTLVNFWKLLFWANELWRCILFEEENEAVVEKNKQQWAKELESWTSLVLKCDWRDYFVIELEVEVRKLTLSILECIVTAGYFEQKNNRYEILYRIMKDVLEKDAFRDARNVQHVLKIVTWSVSDVMILRYICYKDNDARCLARLIGENVLKLCRQETDRMTLTLIYLDYLYLLETLMLEKPIKYHQSKYARTLNNDNKEEENVYPEPMDIQHENIEDEFIGTQLACPVKYKIQQELPECINMQMEILKEELNCWLHPKKYEDPFGKLNLCQCRKVLMGTSIFLLNIVFESWRKWYLEWEIDMETLDATEQDELIQLEISLQAKPDQTMSDEEKKKDAILRERLKHLQQKKTFLDEYLPKMRTVLGNTCDDLEWNCEDIIKNRQLLPKHPVPQWFLDLKRQGDTFDLVISKGILVMSFLQDESDNLAAAISTEAYKTFMLLLPRLRLTKDQIVLNIVDQNILRSVTQECEEEHLNVSPYLARHSQCSQLPNGSKSSSDKPREVEFFLKELSNINVNSPPTREDIDGDFKTLKASKMQDEDVASCYEALLRHWDNEFLQQSGYDNL